MVNHTHRYVSIDDVYRTSGIRSDVVSRPDVEDHIERAEVFVCRLTKNIYYNHNLEDESVTSATDNTLTSTGSTWGVNQWSGQYVYLTSGTGSRQFRKIISNTADTLTINRDWHVNPDATSSFSIFYVPKSFNPFVDATLDDAYDGNGNKWMYLPKYPLVQLEYLEIADVEVNVNTVYKYKKSGKIELSSDSEQQVFQKTYPQQVQMKYWYGVDDLTDDVKRLVELKAALGILSQQMGGTFDVPSTFSLPDLNVSIGQAYINIKGTVDVLQKEYDDLVTKIRIYPVFG